jgi:cell division topological specificity factor
MSILDIFRNTKKSSANIAKDRLLHLVVEHRRIRFKFDDLDLEKLQNELIQVIEKFLPIKKHQVTVEVERDDKRSILELKVVSPENV